MILEIGVIVIGLVLGYWAVSTFVFPDRPAKPDPGRAPPPAPAPVTALPFVPPWYEVLQVKADASPEDIRAAYERLSAQYDPTKLADSAAELQELARHKSEALDAAYARARRERGLS